MLQARRSTIIVGLAGIMALVVAGYLTYTHYKPAAEMMIEEEPVDEVVVATLREGQSGYMAFVRPIQLVDETTPPEAPATSTAAVSNEAAVPPFQYEVVDFDLMNRTYASRVQTALPEVAVTDRDAIVYEVATTSTSYQVVIRGTGEVVTETEHEPRTILVSPNGSVAVVTKRSELVWGDRVVPNILSAVWRGEDELIGVTAAAVVRIDQTGAVTELIPQGGLRVTESADQSHIAVLATDQLSVAVYRRAFEENTFTGYEQVANHTFTAPVADIVFSPDLNMYAAYVRAGEFSELILHDVYGAIDPVTISLSEIGNATLLSWSKNPHRPVDVPVEEFIYDPLTTEPVEEFEAAY